MAREDREVLIRWFHEADRLPDQPTVRVLTTVANSLNFGRYLRIVLLVGPDDEDQVILASTDTEQHTEEFVRYNCLLYQIQIVIRDAK